MSAQPKRVIRSEALDALRAKHHDARKRLAKHFVAFVRAPHPNKECRGWLFYATDNHLATHVHRDFNPGKPEQPIFTAFIVGNPRTQVHESRELIQELCAYNSDQLDEQDCHAQVVVNELRSYQMMLLEDKDEAWANAVEIIFFDDRNTLYWCAFDGSHAGQAIRGSGKSVIIRGCYDDDVRREVNAALRRHCLNGCPNRTSLLAAVRKIRKATKLPYVAYVPIP